MPENRIKICTLWSLEKVKPNYTFDLDDRRIYNEKTGLPLREMKDSGGYRKVELQTVGKKTKPLYVRIHKIVALAMIHNGPYELIEHLDDDKENNDPGNLAFSTHRENAISMLRNGKGTLIHLNLSSQLWMERYTPALSKKSLRRLGFPDGR